MPKRAIIGLDIGGTKTLAALFNEKFQILSEEKFKTHPEKNLTHFLGHIEDVIGKFQKRVRKDHLELSAIGTGIAGSAHGKQLIIQETSVPFLRGFPIGRYLMSLTGVPILLQNDVHLGLYGEQQLGVARGLQHVLGVFFGTGVGGALMIAGRLYVGASGQAGNIGHYMLTSLDGASGDSDSLNDLVSRLALAGSAAVLAARQKAPHLLKSAGANMLDIRSEALAEAIQKGDSEIERLVRKRAYLAGAALSNLVDFLSPEMVVLGGGLVDAMPILFCHEIEKAIQKHSVPAIYKKLKVRAATLNGHSVTLGAAKMASDTLISS